MAEDILKRLTREKAKPMQQDKDVTVPAEGAPPSSNKVQKLREKMRGR